MGIGEKWVNMPRGGGGGVVGVLRISSDRDD